MSEQNPRSFIVALTGGIGSGKSAVAAHFLEKSSAVFDADIVARDLVQRGTPALAEIAAAFGNGMLTVSGQLDRRKMRDIVFVDPSARRRLEAILHPRVRAELVTASEHVKAPYCILVVPLLAEFRTDYAFVDRVLVVDASQEVQIARLMKRDQSSREDALRILSAQAPREQRLALADDVIDNAGGVAWLHPAIEKLHRIYLELADKRARQS